MAGYEYIFSDISIDEMREILTQIKAGNKENMTFPIKYIILIGIFIIGFLIFAYWYNNKEDDNKKALEKQYYHIGYGSRA